MNILWLSGGILALGMLFLVIGYAEKNKSTKFGRGFVNIFINNTAAEVIKIGWVLTVVGMVITIAGFIPDLWKMIFG